MNPSINITFGWIWISVGLLAGAPMARAFFEPEWLGGFASRERRLLRLAHVAFIALGLLNVVGAMSPFLWVALFAMVAVGFSNIIFNTFARTLLQLGTDPTMHGRVMALHGFVFLGTTPIGGPAVGWVCEAYGARAGLVVAGAPALLAAVWVLPGLRRLPQASP